MKKTIFFAACLFCTIGTFAQRHVATLSGSWLLAIPQEFVSEGSNRLYAHESDYPDENEGLKLYSNDFQLVKTIRNVDFDSEMFSWVSYFNYDTGRGDDIVDITQTLFNSDDKYEYIVGIVDGDKCTGFKVFSDDGTLVNQLTFPGEYKANGNFFPECSIMKFNNKYYLEFDAKDYSTENAVQLIYEIKGGTDGIQLQSIIPMEVSPTVVKKGAPIKVKLGDSEGDKTITITDISGKTIQQMTMPESLTEVSVNTANFSAGMNLITISKNGSVLNTVKVIVE